MAFGVDDDSKARKWFFRIASIAGLVAAFVAIGLFVKKGQSFAAGMTIMLVVPLAVVFAWSWTGSIFGTLGRAKSYVEGVEGDQRHEWYAFKGQRVLPRPARKRGGKALKRGLSDEQIPVLVARDRRHAVGVLRHDAT